MILINKALTWKPVFKVGQDSNVSSESGICYIRVAYATQISFCSCCLHQNMLCAPSILC